MKVFEFWLKKENNVEVSKREIYQLDNRNWIYVCSWVLLKERYGWIWRESERYRWKIMFRSFINGRKREEENDFEDIFYFQNFHPNWTDLERNRGEWTSLSFFFVLTRKHKNLNFSFISFELENTGYRKKKFPHFLRVNIFLPFHLFIEFKKEKKEIGNKVTASYRLSSVRN